MALPASTLSQVCRSVADFVSTGLDAANLSVFVTIGSPAQAAKDDETHHKVNLFFYRIEPFGFDPDAAPNQVGWIRLHCLVTAFAVLEDLVSPGENDLRLLGEVIRLFHEKPVLDPIQVNGETVVLQVVLQPLGTDDINHLWSTQGEVAYRTSVAYEMAVSPVIPREPALTSPLVGAVSYEVRGGMARRGLPFAGASFSPPARRVLVDTSAENWAPHLCFVHEGSCATALSFALGSPELADFQAAVAVLGEPGAAVILRWDQWTRDTGWVPASTGLDATASARGIDPDDVAGVTTTPAELPFDDHAGQAMLYAVRSYVRASDGAELSVRSNPLLVTLYEAA